MGGAAHDPGLRVDHVSIAVPRIVEALGFFQRHFPVELNVAPRPGYTDEFNWCDFYLGDFKLELIDSARSGSFVDRFVAKRGPGLHHWSLEAADFDAHIARLDAAGLRIVDRFEGHGEKTAFISPRSAFGVLVQFWQVPAVMPVERPRVATLRLDSGETVRLCVDHVSIAVRDIDAALAFFERHFPFELRRPPHPGWDGTFVIASFYVNGYKVELIQNAPGKHGFVERFIAQRGEGFHHLSIDVDRLDPYVAQLEAAGVRVVDKQTLRAGYQTAFISPRSAYGVLIQLWQPLQFGTR